MKKPETSLSISSIDQDTWLGSYCSEIGSTAILLIFKSNPSLAQQDIHSNQSITADPLIESAENNLMESNQLGWDNIFSTTTKWIKENLTVEAKIKPTTFVWYNFGTDNPALGADVQVLSIGEDTWRLWVAVIPNIQITEWLQAWLGGGASIEVNISKNTIIRAIAGRQWGNRIGW